MRTRVAAVLVLLVLGVTAYLLTARVDPSGPEEIARTATQPGDAPPHAVLVGRGEAVEPTAPLPWLEALVARTRDGSEDERHEAMREIQRHHAAGRVALSDLLRWALSSAAQGGSDELAGWARTTLAAERPASLALLPEILRAGLGATEAQQAAVAQTLRALETVRAQDVVLVQALFQHDATGYRLKRALVDALDDLGPSALPLASLLVDFGAEVLKDRAESMRDAVGLGIHVSWDHVEYDVQRLLAAMGPEVVVLLVERLEDLGRTLRESEQPDSLFTWDPLGFVAGALAGQGLEGRRALARLLGHEGGDIRYEAAWALAQGDDPLDPGLFLAPLSAALADADPRVRRGAVEALARCGDGAVPLLLEAVTDADGDVRKSAADGLAGLHVAAEHALPPLVALLAGDDEFAALHAARSLATYGAQAVSALDALLVHLQTDDRWFRDRFAVPIAAVAVHAPDALTRAWADADALLRLGLLRVVEEVEPLPAGWRALLDRGLEDADVRVRTHAAARLAAAGRRDVLAPILAGFRSQDGPTRALATAALPHFGREAAHLLPELLERLARQESLWRPPGGGSHGKGEEGAIDAAVRALGRYDLDRMYELLGHQLFNLSYAASAAFQGAGVDGVAYFARVWDDATSTRRKDMLDIARMTFWREEHEAESAAVRQLTERALADPDAGVRLQAVGALDRDPVSRDRCLDVLAGLLADDDVQIVRMAAYRISAQGAHAARIESTVREHAAHPDDETRGYLRTALEAIEDAR